MPPTPEIPVWELDGPHGRERWFGPPGRFSQVLLWNDPVSLDPKDGELHLLRARGSGCAHAGPWPFGFRHCPLCGTVLPPPPGQPTIRAWSSPADGASGVPVPACTGEPDAASRAELPMPGPARLDFVVAGTPPGLLAFDQVTGTLWRWVHGANDVFEGGHWRSLGVPGPASLLPRWSWAAAASGSGVALPGDGGPVWLAASHRTVAVSGAKAGLGIVRSLGGAVAVGGAAALPVLVRDGLAVAFRVSPELGWQCVPVSGRDGQAGAQLFAAPATVGGEAFWVGEHGLLSVRTGASGPVGEYRPWRDGWRPMQAVRPVLSPGGIFHQLGRVDGKQAFEALLPGDATPQRRAFDRYVTSCGSATFAGSARYREPWEPRRADYRGDGTAFLQPLLAFGPDRFLVAECTPRTALRGFLEVTPPADAAECRIMFAGSSVVLADLRMTVRARSVWEIVPVVYGPWLLVYDLPANRCFRFALRGQ